MPELPEVETIVRELNTNDLIGKKIKEIKVFWDRSIGSPEVSQFCAKIVDQVIQEITRRGKFIVFNLSSDTLLIHLRMTGKFTISKDKIPVSSHERVQLRLEGGSILHYEDQRKFGKWYLLSNPQEKYDLLGIEPLSDQFTIKTLERMTQKSSQKIKPFLLNQRHVVGLGNIYVDEALWESCIHPTRPAHSLTSKEVKVLHKAIINVLEQGITHMGTSLGSKQANYFSVSGRRGGNQTQLKVFRREGQQCPRCHTTIIKMVVAQRGTHLCPECQI